MSTIGSIGNNQQSISQLLATMNANSTPKTDNDGAGDSTGVASATLTGAAGAASGLVNLQQQILAAVSAAVGKLDKTSSATDVAGAIQSAVRNTLQQNGIDPAQFQQQASRTGGHHHHHHSKAGASSPAGTNPAQDGTSPQTGTNNGGFLSAVDQILQQNGFDIDQVNQALLAQAAQAGSTGSGSAGNQGTDVSTLLQDIGTTQGVSTKV
jgi:hypothetical protein